MALTPSPPPNSFRLMQRSPRRVALSVALVASLCLVACKKKAQPLPPAQAAVVDESVLGDREWRYGPELMSPRTHDAPPPAGSVRVDVISDMYVDRKRVGTLWDGANRLKPRAANDQSAFVFPKLLESVKVHPGREHAEVWVASAVSGPDFARALVTLKQAGVSQIHLAVRPPGTGSAGWMLLEDVRISEDAGEGELPAFMPEELPPWENVVDRASELAQLCKSGKLDPCKPLAFNTREGRTEVLITDLTSRYKVHVVGTSDRVENRWWTAIEKPGQAEMHRVLSAICPRGDCPLHLNARLLPTDALSILTAGAGEHVPPAGWFGIWSTHH